MTKKKQNWLFVIGVVLLLAFALFTYFAFNGGKLFSTIGQTDDGFILLGDSTTAFTDLKYYQEDEKAGNFRQYDTKYFVGKTSALTAERYCTQPTLQGNDLRISSTEVYMGTTSCTYPNYATITFKENFKTKKFRADIDSTLSEVIIADAHCSIPEAGTYEHRAVSSGLLEITPRVIDKDITDVSFAGQKICQINTAGKNNVSITFSGNIIINNPRWQYLFEECIIREGSTLVYQKFDANEPFSIMNKAGVTLVGTEGSKDLQIESFCLNKPALVFSDEGFTTTSEVYSKLIRGETINYDKEIGIFFVASNVGVVCQDKIYNLNTHVCEGDPLLILYQELAKNIDELKKQINNLDISNKDKQSIIDRLQAQGIISGSERTELVNDVNNATNNDNSASHISNNNSSKIIVWLTIIGLIVTAIIFFALKKKK